MFARQSIVDIRTATIGQPKTYLKGRGSSLFQALNLLRPNRLISCTLPGQDLYASQNRLQQAPQYTERIAEVQTLSMFLG